MMVLDFFIPEGLVHCNHCICLLNTHEVVCSVIITLLARFLKIKAFFWSVLRNHTFLSYCWLMLTKRRKNNNNKKKLEGEPLGKAHGSSYKKFLVSVALNPIRIPRTRRLAWFLDPASSPHASVSLSTLLWSCRAPFCFWKTPSSPVSRSLHLKLLPVRLAVLPCLHLYMCSQYSR